LGFTNFLCAIFKSENLLEMFNLMKIYEIVLSHGDQFGGAILIA